MPFTENVRLFSLYPQYFSIFSLKLDFNINELKNSFPAILVCGIAQPSIFIKNLKNLNINIIKTITLGDHQQITLEHLNNHNVSKYYIITTEKDLYRNPSVFMKCSAPVYISKLIVKIDVENIFKKHNILL